MKVGFSFFGCLIYPALVVGCLDVSLPKPPDGGRDGGAKTGDAGAAAVLKADGKSCEAAKECEHGNCLHHVCCAKGKTCCFEDAHCVSKEGEHLACNTDIYQCYSECSSSGDDHDERCATGFHCDADACFEDLIEGQCDEDSDCASGECIDQSCCRYAGLCCAKDEECPELFDGCATDGSQTCVYSIYTIPDTGQTQCYDVDNRSIECKKITAGLDYYGQDGHYAGAARSYEDMGDGAVRDRVTGLRWTKAAGKPMSFRDAENYCGDLVLAGRAWRLPKRFQLQSLVDYGVDAAVGINGVFSVPDDAELFWTGAPLAGAESSTAWVVDFKAGALMRQGKDSPLPRTLCVSE